MFWNIFSELCKINNVTPNAVAASIGMSNATCTKWKQGATPGGKSLQKIADYFGVTTSHLLGETAGQHPQEPEEQNEDTAEIADICDKLAQTKAGKARLQFLLEEAQRLLEETEAYEQKRKNLDTK